MLIVNWNFPFPDTDIVLLIFVPILFQACTPLQLCYIFKKVKNCIKKKKNKSRRIKKNKKPNIVKEENESSLGQDI